jgi:hypothetical protein
MTAPHRPSRPRKIAFSIGLAGLACIMTVPAACTLSGPQAPTSPAVAELEARTARFAPVDLVVPSSLPGNEPTALAHLIRAARVMDALFLDQVWAGNVSLLAELAADRTPEGRAALHYFLINKGPWSRLDDHEAFLPPARGIPPKPAQANFYPADATREEVEGWIASLDPDSRAQATSFFTLIRRDAHGQLTAVPYSVAYRSALLEAAGHLRTAAGFVTEPTLKRYLETRAAAFLSNDYYESDLAWMELDATIEPTIGPYETYEDGWFGYKAAFEAFITLRDDAETKRLGMFGSQLQVLEDALPIDPQYRNPQLGALAPIRVVNVIFSAGDANRGVQTAAFNLPNDDRVIREKGSKRVMLKNMQEAKFEKVLLPIAAVALPEADRGQVSFEAFFTHILMHELMHGLGPHQVHATGQAVRQALTDTYATIEEAKADISGLWALQQLADKQVVSPSIATSMYTTFLASAFRSIRFGVTEAHGRGIAIQLNYLLDLGAVVVNPDGTFSVAGDRIRDAVTNLTRDLMTLQATGDYAACRELLDTMGVVRPEVQHVLDRLAGVPVDIEPRFVTANELAGR